MQLSSFYKPVNLKYELWKNGYCNPSNLFIGFVVCEAILQRSVTFPAIALAKLNRMTLIYQDPNQHKNWL